MQPLIDTGLTGKVVLISGGNHGIGAATAKAFAAVGSKVLINYHGAPPASDVVRAIVNSGGQADTQEADLADPASIPRLFDLAERVFGPVDILVNNAAHAEPDTFLPTSHVGRDIRARAIQTVTAETHDRHFAVNSRAVALMMAEYAHRYVARGAEWGRIINVSTEGAPGWRDEVSYWASKNALESFSRSAAEELGRFGITVNIVSPGAVQTGWIPKAEEPRLQAKVPLGRIGQPEDVADVILFLASEQARWLTGQTVFAGGGGRVI